MSGGAWGAFVAVAIDGGDAVLVALAGGYVGVAVGGTRERGGGEATGGKWFEPASDR